MIKAALMSCFMIAQTLLSASAAAESIETASAAFSAGRYVEAADSGEALGTASGHALAAEALATYAHYLAQEEEKEPLLQRAMRAAEAAIELDPANAEAYLQSAHATGRYSQLFSPMKSLREGFPKKVRTLIERAIELDPSHFGAHLSLASWHAEAVGRGGMMARVLLGANKKAALAHFEQAMALAPDSSVVFIEYASGLLLLEGKKRRREARDLLVRAIELPPQDAFQRVLRQQAVERLAALDGDAAPR